MKTSLPSPAKIADGLEAQGCKVRHTNNGGGYVVILTNGELLSLHLTVSDRRAAKNQRAKVRRAGLVWPLDPEFATLRPKRT